jgi:pSer/pThr/pTyr-binding forkhead associated (FHA) protein
MKLSLVVVTPGKMEGKSIPITLSQFLIGRDPQCHLRPASTLISKRHCAVLVRGEQAFVRDFDSTNGTSVNDEPVKGEKELMPNDRLKVGPLEFRVVLEKNVPVSKPTPVPQSAATLATSADEVAAAVLLSGLDEGLSSPSVVDSDGVPTGSTVLQMASRAAGEEARKDDAKSGGADREKAAKAAQGDTSSAAKAILEQYRRRPRG